MPPESWKHGRYDEKFDIFSLGVLMVQIITMLPPNPSDRADSPNVIVPEVKRRENHLKLIEGHTLEDFAVLCLHEDTTARPTAGATCLILQRLTIQCRC